MKKLVILVFLLVLVAYNTSAQYFKLDVNNVFLKGQEKDYTDQNWSVQGKWIVQEKKWQRIAIVFEGIGSTRPREEGRPVGIRGYLEYYPLPILSFRIGGGISSLPKDRGRFIVGGTVNNEIFFLNAVFETGGMTGVYTEGKILFRPFNFFSVGGFISYNDNRSWDVQDGYGPYVELSILDTPLSFYGMMVFPWSPQRYGENPNKFGVAGMKITF